MPHCCPKTSTQSQVSIYSHSSTIISFQVHHWPTLPPMQASPESRRQALKQRALNLAAERKAAAAEESTHLRERQFADSCDPLRLRQSQLAAQQAVLDQQAQVSLRGSDAPTAPCGCIAPCP